MMTSTRIDEALDRLKGVFLEVPGTAITSREAGRLTGLDESMCAALLGALEQARFLCRSRTGRFLLRTDSPGASDEVVGTRAFARRNDAAIGLS
jgi:hypothetical protein